jgi:hypothetical protein
VKLNKIILIPLLLIGLVYFGIKGYIHYKTKASLDKLIQTASPLAQIDYTDVGSELSGKIHIYNVNITPTGTYDEVSIQQLTISGKGFTFLLDLARGLRANSFPTEMEIEFKKLQSPVSGSFFQNITSSFNTSANQRKVKVCSIPGILNSVGLDKLNISTLTMDGMLGYLFDKEAGQADFVFKYELTGVESTLIELSLSQISQQMMIGLTKLPVIEQFRFVRQFESEYIKQIVNHCSTEASLAASDFIDDLFTQSDNYYLKTIGFVPGPGLSELFRQLITNAGTVEITASPSSEISPVLLKAYRPEDLVDLFGVAASYNSTPITDLSFSMQSSSSPIASKPKFKIDIPQPTKLVAKEPKQRKKLKPKLRYIDTEISDLKKYINYKVRAYTLNNKIPKQGLLASIVNNTLNIEHLLFSGKMTSHLHVDRIEKIQVLRKDEPNN